MKRLRFRFTPEAAEQAAAADAWWQENRRASPALFADEFNAATELITRAPGSGQRYPTDVLEGIRRVAMQRTRFHVYYVVRANEIVIVSVWSAVRGHGPGITPP